MSSLILCCHSLFLGLTQTSWEEDAQEDISCQVWPCPKAAQKLTFRTRTVVHAWRHGFQPPFLSPTLMSSHITPPEQRTVDRMVEIRNQNRVELPYKIGAVPTQVHFHQSADTSKFRTEPVKSRVCSLSPWVASPLLTSFWRWQLLLGDAVAENPCLNSRAAAAAAWLLGPPALLGQLCPASACLWDHNGIERSSVTGAYGSNKQTKYGHTMSWSEMFNSQKHIAEICSFCTFWSKGQNTSISGNNVFLQIKQKVKRI